MTSQAPNPVCHIAAAADPVLGLVGPDPRFQAWRARTVPTDPDGLAAYHREDIVICQATHVMGAQLGEDRRRTEAPLQSAKDVIPILRKDVSFL